MKDKSELKLWSDDKDLNDFRDGMQSNIINLVEDVLVLREKLSE